MVVRASGGVARRRVARAARAGRGGGVGRRRLEIAKVREYKYKWLPLLSDWLV